MSLSSSFIRLSVASNPGKCHMIDNWLHLSGIGCCPARMAAAQGLQQQGGRHCQLTMRDSSPQNTAGRARCLEIECPMSIYCISPSCNKFLHHPCLCLLAPQEQHQCRPVVSPRSSVADPWHWCAHRCVIEQFPTCSSCRSQHDSAIRMARHM